jgi:DNA topoisomerase-1
VDTGPEIRGKHPETQLEVSKKSGRFGPYFEMGEGADVKRASIPKDIPAEDIGLEWAVKLLSLPRTIGIHPESGEPVTASIGRYGPYLAHNGKYARLQSTTEVFETGMNSAVVKLAEALANPGRGRGAARAPLKEFGKHPRTDAEIKLMEGRFGPYVTDGTTNATLPKSISPDELTLEEAAQLIDARAAMPPKGKVKKKAAPKKKAAAPKKAAAKAKPAAKAKT